MKTTYHFDTAGITYRDGNLVINASVASNMTRHYNVDVTVTNDTIEVESEKPEFGLSLDKGDFDINLITEDSIDYYKPWPWSKTKKARSNNIVEYKQREKRVYKSNSWTLITN